MVSAIYVSAPDKSSGKRQQKIEIYYDGAGFIPLNLLMQRVRRDRSHAVLSPKIGTFNFFLFYGHRPKGRFVDRFRLRDIILTDAVTFSGQTLFSFPAVRGRKEVAHVQKKAFRLFLCAVILLYIFCIKAR